jgi:hypothetical protein
VILQGDGPTVIPTLAKKITSEFAEVNAQKQNRRFSALFLYVILHQNRRKLKLYYSILAYPVVSVFCQLSPKQQKYQNFPYKKAVRKWLR